VKIVGVRLNRMRGTARLIVRVPRAGALRLSGRGIRGIRKSVRFAGRATALVMPKAKLRVLLANTGTAPVRAKVTFDPASGATSSDSKAIKLTKTLR
jgi:hypothetical protein